MDEALAAHDAALASGQGVLKSGARTAVTRVPWGDGWACVKEYRKGGLAEWFKALFHGSRLRRALRGARLLAAKGIDAPEVLAVAGRGASAFLVTRHIGDATPLNKLLAGRFGGALSGAELRAKRLMLRELAAWLRRVHDLGVYHDDWSAKNFLAAEREGRWAFYLLDFESLSAWKCLTRRRIVKNLGQLADAPACVTRTDKMRFLVAYAAGDAGLKRGRFPRQVLRFARRRADARERQRV
ncbi:MAG: hypothetical protein FJ291_31915 [Planctomycetes bacterium]|nr:hypothetical protein [Planctomycetota bacterium]